jgi:para-nitrobenzyl esterase
MVAVLLIGSGGCAKENKPVLDPLLERWTEQGPVRGKLSEPGAIAWLGVPFADVTERWTLPKLPRPRTEPLAATNFREPPLQLAGDSLSKPVVGSEDCLYVDIFAPVGAGPDESLPVMFWIYGGGQTSGSSRAYDASRLAAENGVVVIVTNYRVGPFGWFHHPSIIPEGASGHFALYDLMAALEWVRRNAASFGGDPLNITIFGESAGAQNVLALYMAPAAEDLFDKAIIQSGGFWNMNPGQATNTVSGDPPGTPASATEIVIDLLLGEGRVQTREAGEALAGHDEGIGEWLRQLPNETILEVYRDKSNLMYNIPSVVYDGVLMPATPGSAAAKPLLVGANRDEQKLFQIYDPSLVRWTGTKAQIIDTQRYEAFNRYYSHWLNFDGVDQVANMATGAVYAYRFDWDDVGATPDRDWPQIMGAAHGLEIPFVFGNFRMGFFADELFDESNNEGRIELSASIRSYWTQFARTGNPGRGRNGTLPRWELWNGEQKLVFDAKPEGGIRMESAAIDIRTVHLNLWADQYLTDDEKCGIYKDMTMYPAYPVDDLKARGCW